ncbi:RNA polymerase II-associated protein 3-like isoform X2 [Camellia sinensis]|uniref:RNA polymerase II-associated protein 3-like isoform X2 n=1 Tax=Camellia sinensis TaxID=4442 RepID=UPI001035EA93|nr:RNA polymerase II-associated protein 3-like isoform X2 [Camellia sinensis]
MARAPSKHGRDQSLGFLNKLQDWEMSPSDRDKKLKPQGLGKENLVSSSQKIGVVGEDRRPRTKAPASDNPSTARQYDHLRNYDSIRNLSSGFMTEESSPDAASEKELGNEFFKQKKFKEAIDCYSRGIALSPTAVAYANRGMAYLKIRRFQEAEDDCTEALNLDDRYIKAYSRRSTARKELGKLKESMEDAEFAMRLEPLNQEIKKQYAEAKSLYEKEILKKASGSLKNSMQGVQKEGKSKVEGNGHDGGIQSVSSSSHKMGAAAIQDRNKDSDGQVPARTPMSVVEAESKSKRGKGREADASSDDAMQSSGLESSKRNHKKQELKASVQELAAQAASLAKIEAAKNITPPNSAYQFEVSWRGLAGDHTLQARLLKVTSPVALPQIFKNALSAPILIEIIRCIVTFFCEEMDLAVKYLENLAKVSRFDMIIMCLSSTDKTDLHKIWDDIFCSNATPMEYAERLDKLQSRYCPKQ